MEKATKILIGIDIGEHSIKAVKLERTGSEARILDFAIRETVRTPEGKIDPSLIKNCLTQIGSEGAEVHSVVSGQDVVVKHAIVPFMPKEELRDAVRWSLKESVNFNLEESALDFQILGSVTGTDGIKRNEVLAVAVNKDLIDKNVKLLQDAGVEPALISITHFALANFLAQNERLMSGKTNVLLDIGFKTTTILIFKGTTLEFIRKITSAGDSFTKALSGVIVTFPQKIELDAVKAEAVKIKCGIPAKAELTTIYQDIPLTQISVLMRPVLERLLTDIRGSFKYFRDEFHVETIDQIFLSGGGARLKNLVDFVKDGLGGIPTALASLPSNITSQVPEEKHFSDALPELAVSIGVCLAKDDAINLIPRSVKIQKTIGMQQKILQFAAIAIFIIMAFTMIRMKLAADRYQKMLTAYNDYYSSLIKLRTLRDSVMQRQKFYNEIIGQEPNLFIYLKELSRVVPRSVEFEHIKLDRQGGLFLIKGLAYTSDKSAENGLAAFLLDLENSGYFSDVNLMSTKKEAGEKLEFIRFELTVKLTKIK